MKGPVDPSIEQGLIRFFDARDEFVHGDKPKGLAMLRACDHPEAVEICRLFESMDPKTNEDVREVIVQAKQNGDYIGICYSALFSLNFEDLRATVELKHPYAMALLVARHGRYIPTCFQLLATSARMGDRFAICALGFGFMKSDRKKAADCFRVAIQLKEPLARAGHAFFTMDIDDPKRYVEVGETCVTSYLTSRYLLDDADLYSDELPFACVFMIGRYLRDQKPSSESVHLYKTWIHDAQEAVFAWLLVAKRLGLYRDVARLIAQEVWRLRETWYPEPLLLF